MLQGVIWRQGINCGKFAVIAAAMMVLASCETTTPPYDEDGKAIPRDFVVDGVPMRIEYDTSFVQYTAFEYTDPESGRTSMVEPIPTSPAWVVVRNDGKPTSAADKPLALQAISYYCRSRGQASGATGSLVTSPEGRAVWLIEGDCQA